MIEKAYERTKNLLKEKKKELELIAKELLKKEVISEADLTRLIGKRPFGDSTTTMAKKAAKSNGKGIGKGRSHSNGFFERVG